MKKILFLIVSFAYTTGLFAQCPIPVGLFTSNINYNNALANWTGVNGADHYKIQYRVYGTTIWSNLGNIGSIDTTRNLPLLQPITTYEWQIKSFCDTTNQMGSSWSVMDTFTTTQFVASAFNPIITNSISALQYVYPTRIMILMMDKEGPPYFSPIFLLCPCKAWTWIWGALTF